MEENQEKLQKVQKAVWKYRVGFIVNAKYYM